MKLWFLGTLWLSSGCRCQITPLFRCQVLYPQPTRPADWSRYTQFQGQSEVLGSPLALPSALAIAPGARLQVSASLPYPLPHASCRYAAHVSCPSASLPLAAFPGMGDTCKVTLNSADSAGRGMGAALQVGKCELDGWGPFPPPP